jgi:hypothetical protein
MIGRVHQQWQIVFLMAALLCGLTACLQWPAENSSRQPGKRLFEPGMSAVEDNRFNIAKITLQPLINTCTNSEHASKAAVVLEDPRIAKCGESWTSSLDCHQSFVTTLPTD